MCIVIDANVLGKVFDRNNVDHARFKPVCEWVVDGSGSVVFGGSKYLKELGSGKYLKLFTELKKVRRAVEIPKKEVDDRARELKAIVRDENFDDEHIVAIVGLSKCRLVCTDDERLLPYLKRKDLYPQGVRVPKVYRSTTDRQHCVDRLLVGICPKRNQMTRRERKPKNRPRVPTNAWR